MIIILVHVNFYFYKIFLKIVLSAKYEEVDLMYEYEMQKAADNLIKGIFKVKPGETVVLTCDSLSCMNVVNAVAASALAAGANPMVIKIPAPDGVGQAADPKLPIEPLTGAVSNCDVWIEFNQKWLLYSTPYQKAIIANKKLRYMCLVEFTEEVMIRTMCDIDTVKLTEFMNRVGELNRAAKKIRMTTPGGTDVTFETDDRHVVSVDAGDASKPGVYMMMGQLNVVPKYGSVNGVIVFDGTVTPPFGRTPDMPIKLTVENSVIVKIEGGNDAKAYEKWLKSFNDPGMLKMAHVAYGFNPGAKLSGNVVEDERVWGATEWGIGYVSPTVGGPEGQAAVSHTDGICIDTSVWLDGIQIMDEGKMVDDELEAMYPR